MFAAKFATKEPTCSAMFEIGSGSTAAISLSADDRVKPARYTRSPPQDREQHDAADNPRQHVRCCCGALRRRRRSWRGIWRRGVRWVITAAAGVIDNVCGDPRAHV